MEVAQSANRRSCRWKRGKSDDDDGQALPAFPPVHTGKKDGKGVGDEAKSEDVKKKREEEDADLVEAARIASADPLPIGPGQWQGETPGLVGDGTGEAGEGKVLDNMSFPIKLDQDAPPGLTAVQVAHSLVEEALEEVLLAMPSWNQFELQLSFGVATSQGKIRIEHEIAPFPALVKMMEESMKALGSSRALEPNRLNAIIRRYIPGKGIQWHRDKVEFFDDDVFGCVLRTRAGKGLEFWHPKDGNFTYKVPERMGVAFMMTGPARYEYQHGIERIDGERISVSWRWFTDSAISRMGGLIHRAPPAPEVVAAEANPAMLSQHEKSFLKCCKAVREIWKLEEKKRGAKCDSLQEQKLQKKITVLKDVTDLLGSLGRDSTLRQKNEDVIQAALEAQAVVESQVLVVGEETDSPSDFPGAAGSETAEAARASSPDDGMPELNGLKCWQCGSSGHFQRDCPQWYADGVTSADVRPVSHVPEEVVVVDMDEAVRKRRGKRGGGSHFQRKYKADHGGA